MTQLFNNSHQNRNKTFRTFSRFNHGRDGLDRVDRVVKVVSFKLLFFIKRDFVVYTFIYIPIISFQIT